MYLLHSVSTLQDYYIAISHFIDCCSAQLQLINACHWPAAASSIVKMCGAPHYSMYILMNPGSVACHLLLSYHTASVGYALVVQGSCRFADVLLVGSIVGFDLQYAPGGLWHLLLPTAMFACG